MAKRFARVAAACLLGIVAPYATAQTVTKPFSALRASDGTAAAAGALVVELSAREALAGVHLRLASRVAPQAGARYVIWVNGAEAAQVEAQGTEQIVALPLQAFAPGINSIQLAQVPSGGADTVLSTPARVDDVRSSVSLDFAGLRPNPAPTLAQLSVAFDRKAWMSRTLNVELGSKPPSSEQLRAAALAMQSIADRMRQVEVHANYSGSRAMTRVRAPGSWGIDEKSASDLLMVGTRQTLSGVLPSSVAAEVTGPFIGVYPADAGKSLRLVISGLTDADCLRAAQVFAVNATAFPAKPSMTVDAASVRTPGERLALSLERPDPALIQAALNFIAIRARATDVAADPTFALSPEHADTGFLFGRFDSLSPDQLHQLPAVPPLQPGQAVSLTRDEDSRRFVALLGDSDASVAAAVNMLRDPAVWTLFEHKPALFDTTVLSATPFATARRSAVANIRLLLAEPKVFWSALFALLALAYVFLNSALKAQVASRLATGERVMPNAPNAAAHTPNTPARTMKR